MSFSRATFLPLVLASVAIAAESGSGSALTKRTPFAPEGGAASVQASANETIEFVGISSVGKHTDLIFVDKTSKKNHWIAKGETKEGITVLNYDPKREEAVVTINGTQKTLALRQPSPAKPGAPVHAVAPVPVGFNVPPPSPLPVPADLVQKVQSAPPASTPAQISPAAANPAPAPTPNTPEAVAKAETEARMLVSDLLEIGMAQRKAYEEAQRKAAEGKTDPATPPQPAQTPEQPKP